MGSFVGGDANGGNVTTLTGVTWPAVQANDFAVLAWTASTSVTFTTPSGWTLVNQVDDDTCRTNLFTKVCTGSESGDVSLVVSGTTRQSAVLAVYRGYTGIDVHASATEAGTATSHDCPAVTTTVSNAPVIVVVAERLSTGTTTATPPSSYSVRNEFGTSGAGGTYTGLADDGLAVSRGPGSVDPASWSGMASAAAVVTRTIALVPSAFTLSATGATTSGGSAAIGRIMVTSGTGSAGLSDGTAAITIVVVYQVTATGTGTTSGSAAMKTLVAITATGTGTTSGSGAITVQSNYALTSVGETISSGSAQIVIADAIFEFTPPTHEEQILTSVAPLFYFRLTWAASIVRVNGTFTTVRAPHVDMLLAAGKEGTDYFIGGHIYQIPRSVANELIAAGYAVPGA